MSSIEGMEWPSLFALNTGRMLNRDEAEALYKELCAEIVEFNGRVGIDNDAELCAAIRWAYSDKNVNPPTKRKFDITKNDVRKWVYSSRCHSGSPDDQRSARRIRNAQLLDDLKEQITAATDPCAIWDLICTPRVEDGFKDGVFPYLERHAIVEHPEWRRPEEYIAEKWKAIHDGADAVSDNMSTVLGKRKR